MVFVFDSRLNVHLVPAVPDEGIQKFLHQLRVDWPSELETTFIPEDVLALKQVLSQCPYAIVPGLEPGQTRLADDVIFKVHLKNFLVQQSLEGYDPNLDVCLVTEEKLQVLAELNPAGTGPGGCCRVVHVVSCEGEFQQQQVDLLWRMLDLGAHTALQKHLVCGPVKVANSPSPVGAPQYFQNGAGFPPPQIFLDLEDSSISTKGTKSGAFVMYNCARLATLFKSYEQAVEQGAYPAFPPASELNFSLLREEGEWLLLFNYILPFPETLSQAAQLPLSSKGIRITASTEAVRSATLGAGMISLLCVAGVQVPDPPEHGLQLLLQPRSHTGGKRGPSWETACSPSRPATAAAAAALPLALQASVPNWACPSMGSEWDGSALTGCPARKAWLAG
uniref:DALR anticodon binding domain-containing protein n=1 Tax=Chelonoidis abingdonii TaxID=106734 RepID=A0A8C0J583_CHEAB